MPVVNSTSTVTSVSTSTATQISTIHQTTTINAGPTLVFGLPVELVAIIVLAMVGIVFLFFRFQVKGVPVNLIWIYKNGSAVMFRAREDLQGIFLDIIRGGRKAEIIKKTGLPLAVRYIPDKFRAYIDVPKDKTISEPEMKQLKDRGFKITPTKYDRKSRIRGYLVEKEHEMDTALAYLDVNLGGLKQVRLYASIEGSGETIDWTPKIQESKGEQDSGNTILLGEMKSAAKQFFALLAEAMQGSIKTFLLPLIAGLGIGAMLMVLIVTLTGGRI